MQPMSGGSMQLKGKVCIVEARLLCNQLVGSRIHIGVRGRHPGQNWLPMGESTVEPTAEEKDIKL